MEQEQFVVVLNINEEGNINWYVTDQGTSMDFYTPMRGVRVFLTQDRRLALRYSKSDAIVIADLLMHADCVASAVLF